jgi:hypothetical protein
MIENTEIILLKKKTFNYRDMEIRKHKLKIVRDALQYAVMYAKTEGETAEFVLTLMDVERAIADEEDEP